MTILSFYFSFFCFSARLLCYFSPLRSLWNLCLCRFVQWLLAKNQKQKWLQFLMFQPVLIRESRKGEEGLKMECMEWIFIEMEYGTKHYAFLLLGRIEHYFGKLIIRITCPSISHYFGRGVNLWARVGMSWPSLSISSTFSFLPSKWNVISKPFQFFYDLIYFLLLHILSNLHKNSLTSASVEFSVLLGWLGFKVFLLFLGFYKPNPINPSPKTKCSLTLRLREPRKTPLSPWLSSTSCSSPPKLLHKFAVIRAPLRHIQSFSPPHPSSLF